MTWHQPSLKDVLQGKTEHVVAVPAQTTGTSLEVYDFFAGAGGFSEGARAAGCRVVWVCDNDPVALATHAGQPP